MEKAAFSWISEMMLPTVSTTIFKLEPGHVIRAKDRAAMVREMSKREESHASMGGQGEASANQVATQTADILAKYSEMKQEEGQIPMDRKLPGDGRLSEFSEIPEKANPPDTHEVVTEHAIPGIRQIPSEGICDTTTDIKQVDNQLEEHHGTIAMSNKDPSDSPPKVPLNSPQNIAKPKRNSRPGVSRNGIAKPKVSRRKSRTSPSSARASLEQPQLLRSARKTSTSHPKPEVDWSEGIRPTDDESPKNRRAARKATSASSPDAKPAAADKNLRNKRKASKAKRDSAKRQKAIKEMNSIRAQQPLNADLRDKGQSNGHAQEDAESALRLVDERLENKVTWGAIDMPAASFPVLDAADDEPKAMSQSYEIIERSSDSLSSNPSSPLRDSDLLRSNRKVTSSDIHGRGVTVGQKLTDALREAGVHPQSSPTIDARLSSTQMLVGEIIPEGTNDQFALPAAKPQAQNPFISEVEMGQDEPTDVSTTGEQKSLNISNLSSDLNARTQQTISVNVITLVRPIRNPSDTPSLMHSPRMLERKGNKGEADNPLEISDDSSQGPGLLESESLEMDSMPLPNEVQNHPSTDIPHPEEHETSSESSGSPMPDGVRMSFIQRSESDHTPDSQKPLLSAHTSPRQIASLAFPKSITRSSIVDRNGSPRLRTQTEIKTGNSILDVERFCVQSIRITDSSPNGDSEDSDGYEPESNYRRGRTWCKFQRDMFMEYGIGPEQLTTGITRWSALNHNVRVSARVGQINAISTEKDAEPPHEDKRGDCNMTGGVIAHDHTAPVILPSSAPSPFDYPRIQADDDVRCFQPQEGRMSAENLGPSWPRQLVQGNQDNMDWISDLQAAQRSAQNLLLETNQVSCNARELKTRGKTKQHDSIYRGSLPPSRTPYDKCCRSTDKGAVAFSTICSERKKRGCSYTASRWRLSRSSTPKSARN